MGTVLGTKSKDIAKHFNKLIWKGLKRPSSEVNYLGLQKCYLV